MSELIQQQSTLIRILLYTVSFLYMSGFLLAMVFVTSWYREGLEKNGEKLKDTNKESLMLVGISLLWPLAGVYLFLKLLKELFSSIKEKKE